MKKRLFARLLSLSICAALELGCGRNHPGADQVQSREDKMNVLLEACKKGNRSLVMELLQRGIKPNEKDSIGYTALHYAAANGNIEIVNALLEAGADVNSSAADGYTALHAAGTERSLSVVQALLGAKANVNAKTTNNVTPLMCSLASPYGDDKVSLALIEAGADVTVVGPKGETALWLATTNSSPQVLEQLLKKGANPNVQVTSAGFSGDTPLHIASSNGLSAQVELLLGYRANPEIRNADGKTALDLVDEKHSEIRKLILDYLQRRT